MDKHGKHFGNDRGYHCMTYPNAQRKKLIEIKKEHSPTTLTFFIYITSEDL